MDDDHARRARELLARDPSAAAFGIELVAAGADRVVVRTTVGEEMCNGLGVIHGGVTFLLADTAMGVASNTGEGHSLATSATIDWIAPAVPGATLTATAVRRSAGRRSATWDVEVAADDGQPIALFRGRTRRVDSSVRPEPRPDRSRSAPDQANSEPR